MKRERCSSCGAPFQEHRWIGDLLVHPGLADTWVEHQFLSEYLDEKEKDELYRRRQQALCGKFES